MFDATEKQIMQTMDESILGRVNSVEYGLLSLFYLSGFLLTAIISDPELLYILGIISVAFMVLSGIFYTKWTCSCGADFDIVD